MPPINVNNSLSHSLQSFEKIKFHINVVAAQIDNKKFMKMLFLTSSSYRKGKKMKSEIENEM